MHISVYKRPLFLILIIYSVLLALFLKVPSAKEGDISFYTDGSRHNLEAVITSYPVAKTEGKAFIAKAISVDGKPAKGYFYVACETCGDILRGQKISYQGTLYLPEEDTNVGSFNWAKYLARKNIFCQSTVKENVQVADYSRFWVYLSRARSSILGVFNKNFGPQLAPVLAGITIGEKASIDKDLHIAFQDSGAMHLLVASGSNVGFVTLVVYFLCSLLGAGRFPSAFAALFLALLYTLIAGADAPLVRAYIMTFSSTVGFLLGRKSGVLQGFIIAALAILIFNPQSIFNAGFQMSFLAALSIIFLASNFKLSAKLPESLKFILRIFFVSLAAQAALMPVFTNYFYKVSLSAVFSNIILVPLSGIIMAGGFVVWFLSFIHVDFIFKAGVFALKELVFIFTFLVQFFAALPWSKVIVSALNPFSVAAYFIALFGLLNLPLVKRKIIYLSALFTITAALCGYGIYSYLTAQYSIKGRYSFSVLIKENGQTKVIGGGVDAKTLSRAVLATGNTKIDCLFLNGLSKSAAYGLKELKDIKIRNIYLPYGDVAEETAQLILASGAQTKMLWSGESACGIIAKEPWYQNKDGQISTGGGNNLSYQYKGIETSGNLKQIKNSNDIIKFKDDGGENEEYK
jgi:competence protein ComEC